MQIAAKTEISVGIFADGAQDISTVHWKRLGYLSFDSNEQSQLTARELKSVVLNGVSAQLVRFQFLRCHQNHLNKYDQVLLCVFHAFKLYKSSCAPKRIAQDALGEPVTKLLN